MKIVEANKGSRNFLAGKSAILACLLLVTATAAVYWQVHAFDFVKYDDEPFIVKNRHLRDGLTFGSVAWSFTTTLGGNWNPVVWVSHMVDFMVFGEKPGGHHFANLIFHVLNALLLFVILRRMTGATWRSVFVAALFALHPLNVEAVAWVTARKDVLSTFFWMLTMAAYLWYVERRGVVRYLLVALLMALGLMSKPMLVTLPFLLLLLDFWPLGRFGTGRSVAGGLRPGRDGALSLVLEKIPLLVLSALSSAAALYSQNSVGTLVSTRHLPVTARFGNALVSYVKYIVKAFLPMDLAVFYPHPGAAAFATSAAAFLGIAAVSAAAVTAYGKRPWLTVGWLWYLGTLVPVIGLVQFSAQAMADRFAYVPLVGIYIMVSWGGWEAASSRKHGKTLAVVTCAAALGALGAASGRQAAVWRNSETLYERALRVAPENFIFQNYMGLLRSAQGRTEEATEHYRRSIGINPRYWDAHNNLGNELYALGRRDEAVQHFLEALRLHPHFESYNNLGRALFEQGRVEESIDLYMKSLELKPAYETRCNLGYALEAAGRAKEAVEQYRLALDLDPGRGEALHALGLALGREGLLNEAIDVLRLYIRRSPGSAGAHYNLALALEKSGLLGEAIEQYTLALRLSPDSHETLNNLGVAYIRNGEIANGISSFRESLRMKPDYEVAKKNLEMALEVQRRH